MTDQQIILALAAFGALLLLTLLLVLGYLLGSRGRRGQVSQVPKEQLTPLDPAVIASLQGGAEVLAPVLGNLSAQLVDVRDKVQALQSSAVAVEARRAQEDSIWEAIRNVDKSLTSFQTEERQRWGQEDTAFTSLQRLTAVMLGSARVGATGERVVQDALRGLPPQWLLNNHRVQGKPVEFAVKLPDGHILPIDSKVAAQEELDQLGQTEDPTKRRQLERSIQGAVLARVSEVQQYLDDRAPGFGIAAVSDAAYAVAAPVLSRAYTESRVLVVPYSLVLPFVLLVYEQHRHGSFDLDEARQARLLAEISQHLERADAEINGRMSNALKQFENSRKDLEEHMTAARRALALLNQAVVVTEVNG